MENIEEHGFSFDEFSIEMEDFVVRKTGDFDRMWKVGVGGSIINMPFVQQGVIYFGSLNHNVYSLQARSGTLVWKFRTEGVLKSSPILHDGIIFIGSFDYNMYALHEKTGELVWKFKTEGEINSTPAIENGRIYFGARDHNVYCLDEKTGRLVWKFKTGDNVASTAAFQEGKVFIGSFDYNLYCIDATTGQLVWKLPTQGEIFNEPPFLIHKRVIYFASMDNYLRAVDFDTGKLIWKFKTGNYGNSSSPVLYKDVIYHSSRDGSLFALSLKGVLLWKFKKNYVMGCPVIFEDRIYVGGEDKNFYCLSLDGKEIWRFETQGANWFRPALWKRMVFFTSWDCSTYAINIDNRQLVWKFRAEGEPSFLPPAYESFEIELKIPHGEVDEERKKTYELGISQESQEIGKFYKSRITYQVSTHYREKGKYQTDSDEKF